MQLSHENFQKLAIITSITGMLLLVFLTPEAHISKISEIDSSQIGMSVSIVGEIKNLKISEKTIFFYLENDSKIKCVYFSPPLEEVSKIRNGTLAKVKGKIELYDKNLELIIAEVKKID